MPFESASIHQTVSPTLDLHFATKSEDTIHSLDNTLYCPVQDVPRHIYQVWHFFTRVQLCWISPITWLFVLQPIVD